jgi:heme exporter protein CcmD
MTDFFDMHGYAFYVWSSYALGVGALLLNIWWARRNLARARVEAKRRLAMRVGE